MRRGPLPPPLDEGCGLTIFRQAGLGSNTHGLSLALARLGPIVQRGGPDLNIAQSGPARPMKTPNGGDGEISMHLIGPHYLH